MQKKLPKTRIRTTDRSITAKHLQSSALPTELLSEVPTYLQLILLTKSLSFTASFFVSTCRLGAEGHLSNLSVAY